MDYQETDQMNNTPQSRRDTDNEPKHDDDDKAPESAESSTDVKAPFAPHENDDSALGDTDQHSTA